MSFEKKKQGRRNLDQEYGSGILVEEGIGRIFADAFGNGKPQRG